MTAPRGAIAAADANRRRYEDLRATGQGPTIGKLPPMTVPGSVPIDATAIVDQEEVPEGWYMTMRVRRGEVLRLVDVTGTATPAMVAWRAADPSERINLPDTLKVQWTAALRRGRIILSDMGRVMLSIVEDTCGAHDALIGGSAPDAEAPDRPWRRSTRDNLLAAAAKLGLERRDIPSCLSLFAPVSVDTGGRFRWNAAKKRPGDLVDLRAEMDLLCAVSNCPHPLHPGPRVGSIHVIRHTGRAYGAGDPCRSVGAEAIRAFALTDRLAG